MYTPSKPYEDSGRILGKKIYFLKASNYMFHIKLYNVFQIERRQVDFC